MVLTSPAILEAVMYPCQFALNHPNPRPAWLFCGRPWLFNEYCRGYFVAISSLSWLFRGYLGYFGAWLFRDYFLCPRGYFVVIFRGYRGYSVAIVAILIIPWLFAQLYANTLRISLPKFGTPLRRNAFKNSRQIDAK